MPLVRVRRWSSVATPHGSAEQHRPPGGEASAARAEGGGGVLLPPVQRDEGEALRLAGDVEGRGDLPQVGASEVAGVQRRRELGRQRPVGQYPLDAGDEVGLEGETLAAERGA